MKELIIALAVASTMAAATVVQADATLFGSVRYDITDKDGEDHVNSEINRVRVGVKGEEIMDSGLTAGYFVRFEGKSNASEEATKDSSVGVSKIALFVSGGFGKVILGDADAPTAYIAGRQAYTAIHDGSLEIGGDEFKEGGISYESNNVNGFTFRAGVGDIGNRDDDASNNESLYGFSVDYDNDIFGVTIAAGEMGLEYTLNGTAFNLRDRSVAGISGEYKFGAGKVGLAYQNVDDFADYTSISAKYIIDKLTLAAQYEVVDFSGNLKSLDDIKSVNVSAKYDLGGNASVALSYLDYNDAGEDQIVNGGDDELKLRYAVSF